MKLCQNASFDISFKVGIIREILGPDLVIISLGMSEEERNKRIMQRHIGDEGVADMLKAFECEPGADGEAGTINVEVTADMSKDQVVDRVKEILQL